MGPTLFVGQGMGEQGFLLGNREEPESSTATQYGPHFYLARARAREPESASVPVGGHRLTRRLGWLGEERNREGLEGKRGSLDPQAGLPGVYQARLGTASLGTAQSGTSPKATAPTLALRRRRPVGQWGCSDVCEQTS